MTPWVTQLIVANIAVFLLTSLAPQAYSLLALVPVAIIQRPWTLVTYMFLHAGLMHLFFNMIGLFFCGPRLESRLGARWFLALYFVSGVIGALLTFVFSPGAAVVGASGAVYGVLAGYARFWPEDRFYLWGILPVTPRMMVIGLAVFSIASSITRSGGGVAHFAHLGGLVGGWLIAAWWQRTRKGNWPPKQSVIRTPLGAGRRRERWQSIRVEELHVINRTEAERIIGKLNAEGEGSLTLEEQQFLDRFSAG